MQSSPFILITQVLVICDLEIEKFEKKSLLVFFNFPSHLTLAT